MLALRLGWRRPAAALARPVARTAYLPRMAAFHGLTTPLATSAPLPAPAAGDRAQPDALYAAAITLRQGKATKAKVAAALEQAAYAGSPDAMLDLGLMYANDDLQDVTRTRARDLLLAAADAGHPKALYCVALFYRNAEVHGLPRDLDECRRYLRRAAALRYPQACFMVAMNLLVQRPAQPREALEHLLCAAQEGHAASMIAAAALLLKDVHSGQWVSDPEQMAADLLQLAVTSEDEFAVPVASAWLAHLELERGFDLDRSRSGASDGDNGAITAAQLPTTPA